MRMVSLQYLRGAAALMVLIAHSFEHQVADVPDIWGKVGHLGVQVFFVISGFIINYSAGPGSFDPRDFAAKRIIRIVPVYWLCTIATAILVLVAPTLFKTTTFDLPHFIGSLFFIPMYRPGPDHIIAPIIALGYTLNFEIFFYTCFMFLFFTTARNRTILLSVIFALLIVLGKSVQFDSAIMRFYTSVQLMSFCGGLLICELYRRWPQDDRIIHRHSLFAAAICVACLPALATMHWTEYYTVVGHGVVALFSTALCYGVVCFERSKNLRALPSLQLIGDASYSIYITHMFMVLVLYNIFRKLAFDMNNLMIFTIVGLTTAVAALAASLVFYFLIEKPLTAWLMMRHNRHRAHMASAA